MKYNAEGGTITLNKDLIDIVMSLRLKILVEMLIKMTATRV